MAKASNKTKVPDHTAQLNAKDTRGDKPISEVWPEVLVRIISLLIVFGLPFYFFVWKKIPAGKAKWISASVVVVILCLLAIFTKARHIRGFKIFVKTIPLLLVAFGPVCVSIFLKEEHQVQVFKFFIILFFSLLPAWLYLQFISTKGKTMRDEYVVNLFRLHVDHYAHLPKPPEHSIFHGRWLEAQEAKGKMDNGQKTTIYERKFVASFGSLPSGDVLTLATFRNESLWPVAIATLIISVGWVLVVRPGSTAFITDSSIQLLSFRFAFLGAYFYILQMLVRRYFQNDLRTSAYINAIMRIIIAILLVWVVDMVLSDKTETTEASRAAFAFVIGVFPYVGWRALLALITLPVQFVVPSLRRKYPLSDLDGLNVWYESRLLEEGIEDMQNLATANLVDVILNTRIPVDRLVDWVDQSLLYLHVGKKKAKGGKSDREKLRRFGIRTATDLQDVLRSEDQQFIDKVEYLLNIDKPDEPGALRCIEATFRDDPNLYHVKKWREFAQNELKPDDKET